MKVVIYSFNIEYTTSEIVEKINNKRFGEDFIKARESKFSSNEVFIQYYYVESIEDSLKKVIDEDVLDEIVSVFKNNGHFKILRKTYCFIDVARKTLEIYRGLDKKTEEIAANIAKCLNCEITQIKISPDKLIEIINKHSTEVRQLVFSNVEGLFRKVYVGRHLERNNLISSYLKKFYSYLTSITIKPKIRFLNGNSKYSVTINANKSSLSVSNGNNGIKLRPRFEIRQLTSFFIF
ncbi:MAG: hypothetical protein RMJ17_00040 [Candidatus Aenigmarchaeota archaeon]|nr:hypothetical protein [Candidatus Aenigmarchaeota archaeon]MDW8148981.1 hypothetical protein [Candidatus Aenigmarchaeota archaeon]